MVAQTYLRGTPNVSVRLVSQKGTHRINHPAIHGFL